MIELDIDLLHKNTELYERELLHSRGSGRTTVIIERLIGSMFVSPPMSSFALIGHNFSHTVSLKHQVYERLRWYGEYPKMTHARNDLLMENGTHLLFSTPDRVFNDLRGIRLVNYFIDDVSDFYNLNNHEEILSYLQARCYY